MHRVTVEGNSAAIQFSGNSVRGPQKVGQAMQFVADSDEFAVRELPGLSDEEKVILGRSLIKEGLLRIA
jgi:hypothetical protein